VTTVLSIANPTFNTQLTAAPDVPADSSAMAAKALAVLPIPIVLLDDHLRLSWANDAARAVLQLPAGVLTPTPAALAIAEISSHAQALRALLDGTHDFSFEVRLQRNGVPIDATATATPLRSGVSRMLSIALHEKPAAAGHASEGYRRITGLEDVLASSPHTVLVLDDELRVLYANRSIENRSVEQLQGMSVSALLPAEVHDRALAAMRRTLASGEAEEYSGFILDAARHTRYYKVRVDGIRREGRIIGLMLHAGETTDQVNAERAIATQARMIDSMLEGVSVINEKGVIHLANPAFDALFGYGRNEVVGRDVRTLVQWPFGDDWSGSGIGESMTVEFEAHRRGGGHFSAAGVLSGFDIAGQNHSLLVLQDVSERKRLERGLLQAVNREQYRIGNDLHDGLGQELTGIALMLRGLAGRMTTEYPPLLPELEGITRLVNNAIESTRALARGLSPVNLERGGLQDALEGMAMHASELYGVPVVFTHRLSPRQSLNPELANHLYRIAQEAVRNAVRHGKARSIRLHLGTTRAKVKLSIADDGIGMPTDALDSTGMGLKIMCYRARILGGDVSFEFAEPTGTRVVCECPLGTGGAARVRKLPKRRARA
jgi:PAS domain S-box-containing protein